MCDVYAALKLLRHVLEPNSRIDEFQKAAMRCKEVLSRYLSAINISRKPLFASIVNMIAASLKESIHSFILSTG